MRRTLVLMAQAPIPGRVKTRLCPPLSAPSAARLHECCLLDMLSKASAVPDTELIVAYTPAGSRSYFREMAPDAAGFLPQKGRDLGQRLSNCFRKLGEPGRAVVVIGSDSPTLPALCMELAFDVLSSEQVDVVFGPASDGGHYLVGMTAHHPGIFRDIAWGGPGVVEKSVERAAELGLGWYLLPEWHGVRRPADLACLRSELLDRSAAGPSARHTRGYLRLLVETGLI